MRSIFPCDPEPGRLIRAAVLWVVVAVGVLAGVGLAVALWS